MFLRQTAECLQIDHVHSGIGGRFEEKNLCVRLDCRFPRVIVARVDTGRFDTEFREQCIRQPAAGAEQRPPGDDVISRSEEHTSELQSLMRISYAVFCLKNKKTHTNNKITSHN